MRRNPNQSRQPALASTATHFTKNLSNTGLMVSLSRQNSTNRLPTSRFYFHVPRNFDNRFWSLVTRSPFSWKSSGVSRRFVTPRALLAGIILAAAIPQWLFLLRSYDQHRRALAVNRQLVALGLVAVGAGISRLVVLFAAHSDGHRASTDHIVPGPNIELGKHRATRVGSVPTDLGHAPCSASFGWNRRRLHRLSSWDDVPPAKATP